MRQIWVPHFSLKRVLFIEPFFYYVHNMNVAIYLDESGDCGWSFDKPLRNGGSSRYLTLAAVIVPVDKTHVISSVVRSIYRKRKRSQQSEIKSTELSKKEREAFVRDVLTIQRKHSDIKFIAITVRKENVKSNLRQDPNRFYNYVMKLLLLDYMMQYEHIQLLPDARSVKTSFQNSLDVYLKNMIVDRVANSDFDKPIPKLETTPCESKHHLEIQFADILASLFWAKHEYNSETVNPIVFSCHHKSLYF